LFGAGRAHAQKYTFSHYDIEDGLVQSQVNKLYQDNAHRLWIATLGGACRFDGKEYYAVSKANGLLSNFVYQIFVDKSDKVWLGTHKGLACFYDQKVFNFPIPKKSENTWVESIIQDGNGSIWILLDNHLYKVVNHTLQPHRPNDTISSLAVDGAGKLYAVVYKKGVFCLENNNWKSYIPFTGMLQDAFVMKMMFDKADSHKSYLLAYKRLYVAEDANIKLYNDTLLNKAQESFLSIAQDAENNLWIGTTSGAYYINKQHTVHFAAHNGFTDNSVSDIYNDADNNLWFGTEGGGVYKFEGDSYVIFDQSQGVNNSQIVMTMARDKYDNIILGTDGNSLVKYKDGKFTNVFASNAHTDKRIQCLYTDKDKNLWIGTGSSGVWKYNGKDYEYIKGISERSVFAIASDDAGTIWTGTAFGCYYLQNNVFKKVPGPNYFITSLLSLGKDSLLVGTQAGVILIVNKKIAGNFKLNALSTSAVYCMLKINGNVLFGTDDKGLFSWNRKNNSIKNYNIKDGFNSNIVYSLVADKQGIIWVGTGRGVKRISVDRQTMACTLLPNSTSKELIVETNQGASFRDGDKILMGTTKGLTVYNTDINTHPASAPYILIQSVKLFPQDKSRKQTVINEDTTGNLQLSANQNHIAISFLGVYLKNPDGVTYQYKLNGLDDKFCWPVKNNEVDYPSLPPGKYTFEVKAISPDGVVSPNEARFSFEIIPPFYKTALFRVGLVLLLILLGTLLQALWYSRKIQRQRAIETMKREEKLKLRQQTAEDFHDDLGNKLTRITILSEILNTKIDKDKTDQLGLVDQIKQNAAALYNGTKDILWALDPQSDNLFETLTHIKEIGIELFHDTPIDFQTSRIEENLKDIKLPMEYSRNITMILKELLNNVLKHAAAKNVAITIYNSEKDKMTLTLTDDGKGFENNGTTRGHGINNIKARTHRIDAELYLYSEKDKGTRAELKFKKNPKL